MQLRPMIMDDADFMLELKNYPETRKYAIESNGVIDKCSHYQYIADNIQYFQIIKFGDEKAGAIRIKNNEISIWINRQFWMKGIASFVLEQVSEKGMTAKIVNANIPSMKAFINAGFKPVTYLDTYYIFEK